MKKIITFIFLVFTLCSCGTPFKLTGNYPETNHFYAETSSEYDVVWDKVIDFFAVSGIPISNIDKSSGLIVSSKVSFLDTYTREEKGHPIDPNAFVVIPTVRGGFGNILEPNARITGEWTMIGDFNVRIKRSENGTSININMVNLICTYGGAKLVGSTTKIPIKSTGVFENRLLEMLK